MLLKYRQSCFKKCITDFLKLNPHCALFILLQALYNSHSKKILPIVVDSTSFQVPITQLPISVAQLGRVQMRIGVSDDEAGLAESRLVEGGLAVAHRASVGRECIGAVVGEEAARPQRVPQQDEGPLGLAVDGQN
jgi:hypothetical protein